MRLLGIDYGRKRIGLALSDPTGTLARPWKTIAAAASVDGVAGDLAGIVCALRDEDDGLEAVVLGLPRRLSGEPNEQTPIVQALAARLEQEATITVVLQDERLSSREAEQVLARREKDWRRRKAALDAAAAAIILQDYLDNRPRAAAGDPAAPHADCFRR
jgi:putative Holliday junction resolvase